MRVIAVILIILGILGLGYQGFTYVTRDTVVDAGPVQVSADREKSVYIPPVVGGVALVSGLILLAVSGRKA